MSQSAAQISMSETNFISEGDEKLTALRRYLHSNPELPFQEFETSAHIESYYHNHFKPDQIIKLAGHGLAFIFSGAQPGKTVLIRTELDALPIDEINDFDHKSTKPGISHKCGHDGHMSIVTGVAKYFAENRPEKGQVVLLYQPAEETGEGARAVYEDPAFKEIMPDFAFSLHNVPGFKMHEIRCKPGSFTPAVKSMIIRLEGVTAHAAKPHTGINPALAVAEILKANEEINASSPQGSLSTLVHTVIGKENSYGVSAGYAEVHLTMRGIDNEALDSIWTDMTQRAEAAAKDHKLKASFDYTEEFMANMNDEIAVDMVRRAASDLDLPYVEMDQPNPWGEDFGYINSHVTGAMFGLGAGENNPDLHNPDYDFPDELIATGANMFIHLARQVLES